MQFVNRYLGAFILGFAMPFPNTFGEWFGPCKCKIFSGPSAGSEYALKGQNCTQKDVFPIEINGCQCIEQDCVGDLANLILTIFIVQIIIGNMQEIVIPQVIRSPEHAERR